MGLLDFGSKIVSTYKADTSDHKAKIRELSGIEKQAAQDQLKNLEAKNKGYEGQIKMLGKVTVAFGAIAVAGKIAFDAIEFSGRRADLQAAAGAVSIDRLRKATLGLRTDTQLLELAGKLNHAALKLNAEQMDIAGRAATALAERGGDAQEAFDAVTAALVSGKTKGLAPFGIQIDDTKDKASKFTSIMRELSKVQGEVSESTLDASDKIGQQKVKLQNAFDSAQDGIGKVAVEMLPLVEMLASLGGAIGGTLGSIGKIAMYGIPVYGQVMLVKDSVKGNVFDMARDYAGQRATNEANAKLGGSAGQLGGAVNLSFKPRGDTEMPGMYVGNDAGRKGKGSPVDLYALAREQADEDTAAIQALLDELAERQAAYDDLTDQEFGGGPSIKDAMSARMKESKNLTTSEWLKGQTEEQALATSAWDASREIQKANLESAASNQMLGDSYAALGGAVGSIYGDLIDGNVSLGASVQRAAATALKALGLQFLAKGFGEVAEGWAAASTPWTAWMAPMHYTAAKQFFVAAAVTGVGAMALGGGGGGGAGAGGGRVTPSAPYKGATMGGYQGGSNVTIVYGDQFADDSPRNRQRTAQKLVAKVLGSSGGSYS